MFQQFGWNDYPLIQSLPSYTILYDLEEMYNEKVDHTIINDNLEPEKITNSITSCHHERNIIDEKYTISPINPINGSSQPPYPKKRVTFAHIEIHEHNVILGDHPLTEYFPLSLGWDHISDKKIDIDEYEKQRKGKRKSRFHLKLSDYQRQKLLERFALTSSSCLYDQESKTLEGLEGERKTCRDSVENGHSCLKEDCTTPHLFRVNRVEGLLNQTCHY